MISIYTDEKIEMQRSHPLLTWFINNTRARIRTGSSALESPQYFHLNSCLGKGSVKTGCERAEMASP